MLVPILVTTNVITFLVLIGEPVRSMLGGSLILLLIAFWTIWAWNRDLLKMGYGQGSKFPALFFPHGGKTWDDWFPRRQSKEG